jgi:eukaryotic-like serine/threonine-protein kinase
MTDAVTGMPFAGPRVVDVTRRAELDSNIEPNGWFVGPAEAPDRFELLGPGLGGGEGITWRARYRGSETTIPFTLAVKQLRRPPGARADWPTPGDVHRWAEQKELLQYLGLDHLATLVDIFVGSAPHLEGDVPAPLTPMDTPYVVMEWISGRTLADEFGGTPATAATLGARLTHLQHITEGLHAVHVRTAYGTVGTPALLRDVKPENCVIDPARGAVLVDVGTMRLVEDGYEHPGFLNPGYIAPEVLDRPTAPREASADLYSLGALAYFCLLGEDPPPLDGQPDTGPLIGRRLLAAARAARISDPHGFVDHLRLMLHPQPDARPADALAWAKRLRLLATRRRRTVRAGVRIALATVVAVVAGIALTAATVRYDGGSAPTPAAATRAAPADPLSAPAAEGPVTVTAPADGADVSRCGFVEGTATLAPGATLLLAARTLSPSPARRLGPVSGWSEPDSLETWQAATTAFRNLGATSTAQPYQIDVLVVPLVDLEALINRAEDEGRDWRDEEAPASAVTAASITLTRLPGTC